MAEVIQVLERHRDWIKVQYRGELGYLWPNTHLVSGDAPVRSFATAAETILQRLHRTQSATVVVPLAFDPERQVFTMQVLDQAALQRGAAGLIGTFTLTTTGEFKRRAVD